VVTDDLCEIFTFIACNYIIECFVDMGAGMVYPPVQQQYMPPPPQPAPVITPATTTGKL
jgi:hypothetical protein